MSRHRLVRQYVGEDSQYYEDEVFGRSVEEDSPLSPSMAQFIYKRDGLPDMMARGSVGDPLQEEEEEELEPVVLEAIEQIYEFLGPGTDYERVLSTLKKYDNDVGRTLNHLVTEQHEELSSAVTAKLKVNAKPKSLLTPGNTPTKGNTPTDRTPTNMTPTNTNTPLASPPSSRKTKDPATPAAATPKLRKTRPKDIDVLALLKEKKDEKPLVNVAVVGHVDAGKSTLMGHLLCLLGNVSKKDIHKNKTESAKQGKGSFAYAWVLDETGEERARGITMDVAQTRFETPGKIVNLLDAPGHKDFVPNMISGASQAEVAILVVDANNGGFEAGFDQGGQTREHVVLVRALGVQSLIVAINKMENVEWSQDRFNYIKTELLSFFRQVGFKGAEVTFVPVSGMEGINLLDVPSEPLLTNWYKEGTLIQVLDSLPPPIRDYDKPFRFVITDVFKNGQGGLSVAGKVDSGFIIMGTQLSVMPGADTTIAKALTVEDKAVDYSVAGEQCVIVLGGIDATKLHTGNILCEPHCKVRTTLKFRARVLVFNIEVPITKGFPVDLHYQTVSEPAVISRLVSIQSKSNGEVIKLKPRCLNKNQVAIVEIKLDRPICLELFKDSKSLGRITCRYGGTTIASGMVVEIV